VAIISELGAAQAVMLAHGHLVLSIGAYTHDPDMTATLAKIADSLQFAPDAPRTFGALHAPERSSP
jgi:hypothetical protein